MKKSGGRPHRMTKSYDFSSCMDACEMSDLGFNGPKFTWCNNRIPMKKIWKRLDRVFINEDWAKSYQNNTVSHLSRAGSDHRPLLVKCFDNHQSSIKYFKFLDIWIDQTSFMKVVKDTWNINITGNAQWKLQ